MRIARHRPLELRARRVVFLLAQEARPDAVGGVEGRADGLGARVERLRPVAIEPDALQPRQPEERLEQIGLDRQRRLVLPLGVAAPLLRLERLGQQLMAARRHRRLLHEPLELLGGELARHLSEVVEDVDVARVLGGGTIELPPRGVELAACEVDAGDDDTGRGTARMLPEMAGGERRRAIEIAGGQGVGGGDDRRGRFGRGRGHALSRRGLRRRLCAGRGRGGRHDARRQDDRREADGTRHGTACTSRRNSWARISRRATSVCSRASCAALRGSRVRP